MLEVENVHRIEKNAYKRIYKKDATNMENLRSRRRKNSEKLRITKLFIL